MVHKFVVDRQVGHIHELPLALLDAPAALLLHQLQVGLRHRHGVVGRVEARHQFALAVGYRVGVACVVVTEEHHVEARHLTRHGQRRILLVVGRRNAAVLARVEQSDDDVGLLLLLHHAHPLARRAHHLLEAKPAPQVLAQPVGDGGREQADDCDARAATLQDGVGLEVGLVGLGVDDVGAQDGAVGGAHPFVVDPMARLHVVVANGLRVIAEVVDDLCRDVGAGRVHIVGIIVYGLALEDVAIVEQDDVLAMLAAQLVDVCGHTSQRPSLGLAVDEVVGEEATVHVAGLNELQVDGFLFRCHSVG